MTRKQADVIVIGAGIVGLLTAWRLSDAGLRVRVIEKGQIGQEASWAGGGILAPLHPWLYPKPVQSLARWSQAHYQDIASQLNAATEIDPEWTRSGLLILEPHSVHAAKTWAQGVLEPIEIHDSASLVARFPGIIPTESAVFLPNVAQVRNPRLLKALAVMLSGRGVVLQAGNAVASIEIAQGRVQAVMTTQGPMQAARVVVAAGAWSGKLYPLELPIEPVKGQMLMYSPLAAPPTAMILKDEVYLIPRRDGRVLVGSSVEYSGYDKTPTLVVRERLKAQAEQLWPALMEGSIERHWAGLRPGHPDNAPFIGNYPGVQGLYINTGHSRHGLLTAVASSQLLSDIILGQQPILDPAPYAVSSTGMSR
jgi:glycine oxidase